MLISAVWLALQLPVDKPTTCFIIPQFWCEKLNSHGSWNKKCRHPSEKKRTYAQRQPMQCWSSLNHCSSYSKAPTQTKWSGHLSVFILSFNLRSDSMVGRYFNLTKGIVVTKIKLSLLSFDFLRFVYTKQESWSIIVALQIPSGWISISSFHTLIS